MNHRQTIRVGGSGGQLRNISQVVGFELVACPSRGNLRHWIEILHVAESSHSLVVVAPDDEWIERLHSLSHFVRIRPVIHHVTQADRKSTRLNSSHLVISYAVFCL